MADANVWDKLPVEVLLHICRYLSAEDIVRLSSAYSRWAQVAEHQRAWWGKGYLYLSEGGQRLTDAVLVSRVLPVLKRVSVCRGAAFKAYLSGQSAHLEVPNLQGEVVRQVLSSLVPQNLSIDLCLLEETLDNCLVAQLHCLEQLWVRTTGSSQLPGANRAQLRALISTLSKEPLANLRSVNICTPRNFSPTESENIPMDISAAVTMCPALEQISMCGFSSLSWQAVHEYSKLQFLELTDCIIEDISFLDLCPKLRSLSLEHCKPLRRRELSHKSELHSVVLRRLPVDTELLDVLCRACPELESIVICNCEHITNTLPLRHCPRLTSVDVEYKDIVLLDRQRRKYGTYILNLPGLFRKVVLPSMAGLPPELRRLKLNSRDVTSDMLAEIVSGLPHLEALDVADCNLRSLTFLRKCAGLTELSLAYTKLYVAIHHLEGLEDLRSLQKLCLDYGSDVMDVRQLREALQHMPQLEVLDVRCLRKASDLSFLEDCRRLHSLTLAFKQFFRYDDMEDQDLALIQDLDNLEVLKKLVVRQFNVHILDVILSKTPQLEELDMDYFHIKCDFGFVRHCRQLISLCISFTKMHDWSFEELRCLEQLRTLTLVFLPEQQLLPLVKVMKQMPQLEYLGLRDGGPNFLESWKFHSLLSSLCSRTGN